MATTVPLEPDPKELSFEDRVKKFEEDQKKIIDKWGVGLAPAFQSTPDTIKAVIALQDLWPSSSPAAS